VTNQQINNVMLSRNKRKTDELLMTIRDKDLVNFNKKKEKLLNDFKEKGVIMLEKIEIEKVIFDSNMEHDKLWYSQWN
jgi:hypothetical protein